MHGRKLALNEVDKEKITAILILTVYRYRAILVKP